MFNPWYYCDSPLIVEQLTALIKDYKETKITVNELLEKMQNVDKYIYDVLQEMYDDGTLQKILTEITLPFFEVFKKELYKLPHTNELSLVRKWRRINVTGVNDSFNTTELHCVCQGACNYIDTNNIERNAAILTKHTRPTTGVENNLFCVFPIDNQNPIKSAVIPVGHGQGLTYANGYFYVTHSSDNDHTASNSITRIRESDLDYETKYFEGFQPYQIMYDDETQNIYVYDLLKRNIYLLDWEKNSLTYVCPINPKNSPNGACCKYGYFFITDDNQIQVHNKKGELLWCYSIPKISADGFNVGEIESLSPRQNSDEIVIYSIEQFSGSSGIAQRNLMQIFTIDLSKNDLTTDVRGFSDVQATTSAMRLYVSGDLENSFIVKYNPQIYNPIGTEAKPFKTCQEAIEFATANGTKSVEIRLLGTTDRTATYIDGFNCLIRNYSTADITIGGVFVTNGGTAQLEGNSSGFYLSIAQTASDGFWRLTGTRAPVISANGGTVILVGDFIKLSKGSENYSYVNCQNLLYSNYSTVFADGDFNIDDWVIINSITNRNVSGGTADHGNTNGRT